jgi:hypothetical protein
VNTAQDQEQAQALEQQRVAIEQALRAQQEEMNVPQRGSRRSGRGRGGRNPVDPNTGLPVQFDTSVQSTFQRAESGRTIAAVESLSQVDKSPANDPKDLIALNLWVITIDVPREKAAEDLTASLAARANDLPVVIGSRDDVRVLVGKLTVAGLLARSREFRVMALNGQPASIQAGGNQPRIMVAARGGGLGGGANQVQYRSVGTNISFLPRIVAGGNVDVQLVLSTNEQEDANNVPVGIGPDGNPVTATRTTNQQLQTTARVKSGAAALVQSDVLSEPNNELSSIRTQLIILGATVMPALD